MSLHPDTDYVSLEDRLFKDVSVKDHVVYTMHRCQLS